MGRVAAVQVIRWGGEEARTGPWRGDDQVAYLTPIPTGPSPSTAFVQRCLDHLAERGFHRVVTTALDPLEQAGFLEAGFRVHEQLRVLTHDLVGLPSGPGLEAGFKLRRGRAFDHAAVLEVDHLAFAPFWRLDQAGLVEALSATPRVRLRVATGPGLAGLAGYAITGRAGRRGFLQRLAVHPAVQGRGVGRALALDGLRWLAARKVDHAVVNTQLGNSRALALYQGLGFRPDPPGLSVLSLGLA